MYLLGALIGGLISQFIVFWIIKKNFKKLESIHIGFLTFIITFAISILGSMDDDNASEKIAQSFFIRLIATYAVYYYFKTKSNPPENGNISNNLNPSNYHNETSNVISTKSNEDLIISNLEKTNTILDKGEIQKNENGFSSENDSNVLDSINKYFNFNKMSLKIDHSSLDSYDYLLDNKNLINNKSIYNRSIETYHNEISIMIEILYIQKKINAKECEILFKSLKKSYDEKDSIECMNLYNQIIKINNSRSLTTEKQRSEIKYTAPVHNESVSQNNTEQKLNEILKLKENGLITMEEYKDLKNKILNRLVDK